VFESDKQLSIFLELIDKFSSTHIDNEEDIEGSEEVDNDAQCDTPLNNHISSHKVLQLKNNFIPKVLAPLEQYFFKNDVPTKPIVLPKDDSIQDCNVGTSQEPKGIKLSKDLLPEIKKKYVDLFKEYFDVFSWKYENLNTYDTSTIQHGIPLNPGINLFRPKLRQVNHILLRVIEK
jgi:hypothetical protein